jgi:hypothetical protein
MASAIPTAPATADSRLRRRGLIWTSRDLDNGDS